MIEPTLPHGPTPVEPSGQPALAGFDLRPDDVEQRFYIRLASVAMALLIIALTIYLLREFSIVLQQLCVAILLAYLILPAHRFLVRRGLPRWLAGIFLLAFILLCATTLGLSLYASLTDLIANFPLYRRNLDRMLGQLAGLIGKDDVDRLRQLVFGQSWGVEEQIRATRAALGSFFGFAQGAAVVLMYLAFLLLEQAQIPAKLAAAFPEAPRANFATQLLKQINESIAQYILVKTIVSLQVGVLTTIIVAIFGIEYAVLWGIVAFLFNYIPIVGSIIGVIPPAALAIAQFGELGRPLLLVLLLQGVHQGVGFLIEPRLTGDRLDLSPLVVVLALSFGASIWGIVGMILSVPFAAILRIIFEHTPQTRPLAVFLSRAPLPPSPHPLHNP